MKKWFSDRLKERSTAIGLSLLLGSAGVAVSPDQVYLILSGVGSLLGGYLAVSKDQPGHAD